MLSLTQLLNGIGRPSDPALELISRQRQACDEGTHDRTPGAATAVRSLAGHFETPAKGHFDFSSLGAAPESTHKAAQGIPSPTHRSSCSKQASSKSAACRMSTSDSVIDTCFPHRKRIAEEFRGDFCSSSNYESSAAVIVPHPGAQSSEETCLLAPCAAAR